MLTFSFVLSLIANELEEEAERESVRKMNRIGKKGSLHLVILEYATDKQKTHKA